MVRTFCPPSLLPWSNVQWSITMDCVQHLIKITRSQTLPIILAVYQGKSFSMPMISLEAFEIYRRCRTQESSYLSSTIISTRYRESPHNTFFGGNKRPCYAKSCYASPILLLKCKLGGKYFLKSTFWTIFPI